MEHLREFGLNRDPFVNDPVLTYYYESPVHRVAERRLMRGIAQHKGLCLLLGEPGSGKSMLARRLLESLEEEAYEASLLVILQSGVDAPWLLSRVAARLGVDEPAAEPLEILAQAYDRLSVYREEGRRPVLIIDDAHALASREAMEALRALLDLEYEDHHLLTLILVGQAQLDGVLALDPGLRHRLDVRVSLEALDLPTAAAYLGHRITLAGGHPSLFEPEAVEAIQRWGRGLPRRMNAIADNALFEAHLAQRTHVTTDDVERAARDLAYESVEVAVLADTMSHAAPASPTPSAESLELLQEEPGDDAGWESGPLPVFEDAPKEAEEASVFASPPTLLTDVGGDEGMDRDVENLFDNLIED